jgi:hypothetical protein
VRAVHVVGAEAEVPEVDVRIVGSTQLHLESRHRIGDDCEALEAALYDHAERGGQSVHLFVQVGHGQGDVVYSGRDHPLPPIEQTNLYQSDLMHGKDVGRGTHAAAGPAGRDQPRRPPSWRGLEGVGCGACHTSPVGASGRVALRPVWHTAELDRGTP